MELIEIKEKEVKKAIMEQGYWEGFYALANYPVEDIMEFFEDDGDLHNCFRLWQFDSIDYMEQHLNCFKANLDSYYRKKYSGRIKFYQTDIAY